MKKHDSLQKVLMNYTENIRRAERTHVNLSHDQIISPSPDELNQVQIKCLEYMNNENFQNFSPIAEVSNLIQYVSDQFFSRLIEIGFPNKISLVLHNKLDEINYINQLLIRLREQYNFSHSQISTNISDLAREKLYEEESQKQIEITNAEQKLVQLMESIPSCIQLLSSIILPTLRFLPFFLEGTLFPDIINILKFYPDIYVTSSIMKIIEKTARSSEKALNFLFQNGCKEIIINRIHLDLTNFQGQQFFKQDLQVLEALGSYQTPYLSQLRNYSQKWLLSHMIEQSDPQTVQLPLMHFIKSICIACGTTTGQYTGPKVMGRIAELLNILKGEPLHELMLTVVQISAGGLQNCEAILKRGIFDIALNLEEPIMSCVFEIASNAIFFHSPEIFDYILKSRVISEMEKALIEGNVNEKESAVILASNIIFDANVDVIKVILNEPLLINIIEFFGADINRPVCVALDALRVGIEKENKIGSHVIKDSLKREDMMDIITTMSEEEGEGMEYAQNIIRLLNE